MEPSKDESEKCKTYEHGKLGWTKQKFVKRIIPMEEQEKTK